MNPDDVTFVYLDAGEVECWVCGTPVPFGAGTRGFGVPIYEDEILPNDDPGEWGGVPACVRCFVVQSGITVRQTARDMLRRPR